MSLRTVTVKLQDRLLAEIEGVARARGVSRSEILRARLEQAESSAGSVWDRMQDLVIDEDRAPADLSSNKARLRGYGRSRSR
ncbi:MAG: ribbon-helix-helix protein, CopG family [Betaproteobacteria bacterium]|nr:ribbon-helix-helix protein, CopG family [Betaproteobacteria bacterium]